MELYKDGVMVARFFDKEVAKKTRNLLMLFESDRRLYDKGYTKHVYALIEPKP